MEHTTGRNIVERARKAGRTTASEIGAFVAAHYARTRECPDALIDWGGTIYLFFASDRVQPAHAVWRPWEHEYYSSAAWKRGRRGRWARDYRDDTCSVPAAFYRDWFERWQGHGRSYRSPIDIVEQVGGRRAWPNRTHFGVERLHTDDGISTPEQDSASAWLFVHKAVEHQWFEPAQINPDALPQPWYLGHSDVCPARRFARVKGSMAEGFEWDPGRMVDWSRMGHLIVATALETAPSSDGR